MRRYKLTIRVSGKPTAYRTIRAIDDADAQKQARVIADAMRKRWSRDPSLLDVVIEAVTRD